MPKSWNEKREDIDYDIDGVVVEGQFLGHQQARLGATAQGLPVGRRLHKFPAKQGTTVVKDIIVQVGRTGALTPVALLEPVELAGSVVARATLQ